MRLGSDSLTIKSRWIFRITLVIIMGVLGYFSTAQTLGYAMRKSDPARAFALASRDGRVVALFAQQTAGATAEDRAPGDELARRAIILDPTAVPALASLGLSFQARGDIASARRLFAYAERLTRRDLQVQVWAIEDAVGRGNISSALHHYDIALRTSAQAPALLFPILASAIGDPSIRNSLISTLTAKPAWGSSFIEFAATAPSDPVATAQLYLGLQRVRVPIPQAANAKIVATLLSRDRIDAAWSYYEALHPGISRNASRQASFVGVPDEPSAFDWAPINDTGITTSIERRGQRASFEIATAATIGGALLQQLQVLPPGSYRIAGRSAGINQPMASQPYWSLTCRDGRELGRVEVPASAKDGGRFTGRFDVPLGCPVQVLVLTARSSDAIGGLSGRIENVLLSPLA